MGRLGEACVGGAAIIGSYFMISGFVENHNADQGRQGMDTSESTGALLEDYGDSIQSLASEGSGEDGEGIDGSLVLITGVGAIGILGATKVKKSLTR